MSEREYKPVWLPPELHKEVKAMAARRGITMIEFIEWLIRKEKKDRDRD